MATRVRHDKQSTTAQERVRRERVLTKGRASITRSIASAMVIKHDDVYFLAERDGSVPLKPGHGLGLYYHDCRYLNGYELKIADMRLDVLSASAADGFKAVYELTNPDIHVSVDDVIEKEELALKWERVVEGGNLALHDTITVQNFSHKSVELPLSLAFSAGFEDVFAIRGLLPERFGKKEPPVWKDDQLHFTYEGADGIVRRLTISFSQTPAATNGASAELRLKIAPRESAALEVDLLISESAGAAPQEPTAHERRRAESTQQNTIDDWLSDHARVVTQDAALDGLMNRSLRDLRVLQTRLDGENYFAAGIPWFVTLFGRDSLISALQALAFAPEIAPQTLRVLANHQGRVINKWKDEQPGKILHELRVGEMAHLNEIPQTPYYGSVDATPLFLILLGQEASWSGKLDLFNQLRASVELALVWMADYGDADGDRYIEYTSTSKKGLVNQGWKDSGDGIVNAAGDLAKPPISLVEVQGYAFRAKLTIADLFERSGEQDRADQLRKEARTLRERFNRDFWDDELGIFVLALQDDNQTPAAVVSSNPGQALWTGIADERKAIKTAERLMAADMFNGWGIRTLSANEQAYNPIGYHLGTVWPHDNSIIAAGLRRYGQDEAFLRVFNGIAEAAAHFPDSRLPELFAGFTREAYGVPVRYPVACHPQAWAAGAVPFLLTTALGLTPEAFEQRLRIVRPFLPGAVSSLDLVGLKVGSAVVDLRFSRGAKDRVDVDVLKTEGDLHVVVEDPR